MLMTNEVDGGSSKSHAGTTSIWDIFSAKKPKASWNQTGWANGAGAVSSWGAWPVKEPKGNDKVWDQKLTIEVDGGSSKSYAGTNSIWDILSAKKPKGDAASGDKGGWANRAGTGPSWSSGPVNDPRANSRRSFPNGDPRRVSETRESEKLNEGNDEAVNRTLVKNEVEGGSSIWDTLVAKKTRGGKIRRRPIR